MYLNNCEYDFVPNLAYTINNLNYCDDNWTFLFQIKYPYVCFRMVILLCNILGSWAAVLRKRRPNCIDKDCEHYNDVTIGVIASQITSLTIAYSTAYPDADQKKTSEPRDTGLCAGNSPGTGEFPAQMASYTGNVSIWWRHHEISNSVLMHPRLCEVIRVGSRHLQSIGIPTNNANRKNDNFKAMIIPW